MSSTHRRIVCYTDPAWALSSTGDVAPEQAALEREIFGPEFELRLGARAQGTYITAGPRLHERVAGACALVIYRTQITPELLDAAPKVTVIARQGVGIDNLNAGLLAERGIRSFNVPDYCVDEVVAHTMALLLALERGVVLQHHGLHETGFDIYHGGRPRRLHRRVAGIIGFGRIGRSTAQRLRLFYGKVIACDPHVPDDLMEGYGVDKVDLNTLLAESDAVLCHCDLNPSTTGMMNAASFAKMRPDAVFVNTARGKLVESEALYRALSELRLRGAAIDVFSPEDPNADDWNRKTIRLPNVIATSHRAFLSEESELSVRQRVATAVRSFLLEGELQTVGVCS
jgi:phosphoglycerate dehydrogenase-like enzyme